eukprot:TRINITY_DN7122_c0_g1_i1.p1 TRINITY_DN7122_c0_g1~~TRINITY_DN7122_c0_g1_i1.p1  ORF type:complete len:450 (-),score=104.14 TRINITY_DN7122_c0_g1_i1:131-1480(-)
MKIQQVGKMNKPLAFESLGRYPEVQRPEKLLHTHSTRHAVVFAPTEKAKELTHLPDQLAKITYSTENDLKELLEITKACFDREWFSTITSNADVIRGVGDTPKCATSLSDFVMYGGGRNPYLGELQEPAVKVAKIVPKEDVKARVVSDRKLAPSVLRAGTISDTFQTQIRSNRQAPVIPVAKPTQLKDAFELGDDQGDDDDGLMSVIPSGSMGLSTYVDGINDDEQNTAQKEKVHGDAIDIINQRKPKMNKTNQAAEQPKAASSQSIAMPRMTYDSSKGASGTSEVPPPIDTPAPPPIDAPAPPPIDAPAPPPIDMPIPPFSDVPVPPPIDAPEPPPIEMPAPPPINVSVPISPPVPKLDVPPASNERAAFLNSVKSNPFARLKPVAKDKIKDASLTISDKKAVQKNQAKVLMARGQASIMDEVKRRFNQTNKARKQAARDSDEESDEA